MSYKLTALAICLTTALMPIGQAKAGLNAQATSASQSQTSNAVASPEASISNIAVQNNAIGIYSVGRATCSTISLAGTAYGNEQSYGGAISLLVPIGGGISRSCARLAEAEANSLQLANTSAIIERCIAWHQAGVIADSLPAQFANICTGLTYNK